MESVLWRAAGRSAIGGASDGGCSSNDGNSMGEAVVAYFAATFNLPPTILLPLSHRPPVHLQPTYLLLYGALVATGLCNTLLETRHTLTCTGVRRYSRNGRLSLYTHIFHCLAGCLPAGLLAASQICKLTREPTELPLSFCLVCLKLLRCRYALLLIVAVIDGC